MTYSTSLALSRRHYGGRGQNTAGFISKTKGLGPISNTVILIVLACLLGLLYLTQVTKTNAYGYQINDLSNEQTELIEQHDELEVASARLQALERVKDSKAAKSLVSVGPSETLQN